MSTNGKGGEGGPKKAKNVSDRVKLKDPLDFKEFLNKREGSFSIDENDVPVSHEVTLENNKADALSAKKSFFEKCSLKNILVEAVTADDERIVLSDFSTLSKRMTNITEDGGLKKKVDRAGNGQKPPPNAKVWIHYTVYGEHRDEPIDNVFASNRLYAFKLGSASVLVALDLGVQTMELKEIAKFLAEPKYAYGDLGMPGVVEADTAILFVVELVDYMEGTGINAVFKMNKEERALIDFEEVYKAANEMKVTGNKFCETEDWESAISKYRKGVHVLDRYLTPVEEVDKKRNDLIFILYINLAQCYLQLQEFDKVITMANKALNLPPNTEGNYCKAYYRKAKAEFNLGQYVPALNSCKEALRYEPCNKDAKKLFDLVKGQYSFSCFETALTNMGTSFEEVFKVFGQKIE